MPAGSSPGTTAARPAAGTSCRAGMHLMQGTTPNKFGPPGNPFSFGDLPKMVSEQDIRRFTHFGAVVEATAIPGRYQDSFFSVDPLHNFVIASRRIRAGRHLQDQRSGQGADLRRLRLPPRVHRQRPRRLGPDRRLLQPLHRPRSALPEPDRSRNGAYLPAAGQAGAAGAGLGPACQVHRSTGGSAESSQPLAPAHRRPRCWASARTPVRPTGCGNWWEAARTSSRCLRSGPCIRPSGWIRRRP